MHFVSKNVSCNGLDSSLVNNNYQLPSQTFKPTSDDISNGNRTDPWQPARSEDLSRPYGIKIENVRTMAEAEQVSSFPESAGGDEKGADCTVGNASPNIENGVSTKTMCDDGHAADRKIEEENLVHKQQNRGLQDGCERDTGGVDFHTNKNAKHEGNLEEKDTDNHCSKSCASRNGDTKTDFAKGSVKTEINQPSDNNESDQPDDKDGKDTSEPVCDMEPIPSQSDAKDSAGKPTNDSDTRTYHDVGPTRMSEKSKTASEDPVRTDKPPMKISPIMSARNHPTVHLNVGKPITSTNGNVNKTNLKNNVKCEQVNILPTKAGCLPNLGPNFPICVAPSTVTCVRFPHTATLFNGTVLSSEQKGTVLKPVVYRTPTQVYHIVKGQTTTAGPRLMSYALPTTNKVYCNLLPKPKVSMKCHGVATSSLSGPAGNARGQHLINIPRSNQSYIVLQKIPQLVSTSTAGQANQAIVPAYVQAKQPSSEIPEKFCNEQNTPALTCISPKHTAQTTQVHVKFAAPKVTSSLSETAKNENDEGEVGVNSGGQKTVHSQSVRNYINKEVINAVPGIISNGEALERQSPGREVRDMSAHGSVKVINGELQKQGCHAKLPSNTVLHERPLIGSGIYTPLSPGPGTIGLVTKENSFHLVNGGDNSGTDDASEGEWDEDDDEWEDIVEDTSGVEIDSDLRSLSWLSSLRIVPTLPKLDSNCSVTSQRVESRATKQTSPGSSGGGKGAKIATSDDDGNVRNVVDSNVSETEYPTRETPSEKIKETIPEAITDAKKCSSTKVTFSLPKFRFNIGLKNFRGKKSQASANMKRPTRSFSSLIYEALKEKGPMNVSEIYNYLQRTYPYFKTKDSGNWKN